ALEVLLLYPGARWPIFVGKLTANLAFVVGVELIAVPLAGILFHVTLTRALLPLTGVLLLGTFGFVTLGTFYAAVASRTRAREILLPLLLLPMLVPVLIAAAKATAALTSGDVMGDATAWLRLLIAFDLIFFTAAMLVFDAAIGG
ncbi:MAG TPA: heme exporter protein CcmB, partial [Gemmatimonadaceae bacterium]|nr:heme exporter protein CcmB [Gemmatimonadaceae bacterium]